MRAQLLAFTFLAAVTVPVFAADAPANNFLTAKEISGLIEKAKADRKNNEPNVVEPIIGLAPYRAQLEYRAGTAPAAVHETDAELMYVLEGSGNILTGGKLINEKRNNEHNLGGTGIEGGQAHNVVKGDVLIVPEKTPHQVIPAGGAPIVLMTMHVPRPVAWP